MSLRILHSIRTVNPVGGGPIEGLKQLSAVNAAYGHVIEIVSLDDPAAPWVRTCPIKVHALGPGWGNYGYASRLVPWLREHHREYDVVIVNGIWQYNAFAVWRALRDLPTPYFVYTHGMLDPWFKKRYPVKHLKKWLYWFWGDYRVLRDARAVLFTCEEERRLARRSFWLYKCDEYVVNYGTAGAPPDEADRGRAAAVFLEKFPHLRDRRLLLFLGRVHEKKGPDLLFRAFAALLRELPPERTAGLHLVMAGPNDHDYGRQMAALAASLGLADRVTWTGMVQGDLKWGAFATAEAFVLPSHQENFGIAVAEALSCGVPVLISNQVNIWREIEMDSAGLVDTDDDEGTLMLLRRWLDLTPPERDRMRSNAIGGFHHRFHIEQAAISLIRALDSFGVRRAEAPRPREVLENGAPDDGRGHVSL